MRVAKHAVSIGATAVAATIAALLLPAGEAYAAPPIVCVRNLSGGELDVVAGVQQDRPDKPGVYLGKAKARGGACRYADIDGEMNVYFRPGAADDPGEQYSVVPTANGGWRACPALSSTNGWYVYTIRRGRSGLTCKAGGGTRGLEGPGDYE